MIIGIKMVRNMTKIRRARTWGKLKQKKRYEGLVTFFGEKIWIGGITELDETFDKYVLSFEPLYPIYENRVRVLPIAKNLLSRVGNSDYWQCFTDDVGSTKIFTSELQKSNQANAKLLENIQMKDGELAMKEMERSESVYNKDAEVLKNFSMMGKAKEAGQLERLVVIDPVTGNMKPVDKGTG